MSSIFSSHFGRVPLPDDSRSGAEESFRRVADAVCTILEFADLTDDPEIRDEDTCEMLDDECPEWRKIAPHLLPLLHEFGEAYENFSPPSAYADGDYLELQAEESDCDSFAAIMCVWLSFVDSRDVGTATTSWTSTRSSENSSWTAYVTRYGVVSANKIPHSVILSVAQQQLEDHRREQQNRSR
jgi:hypothetical protein